MNIKEETRIEVVDGKKRKYKWYSCQVYIGKDSSGKKIYKRFSGRDKIEIMRQIGAAEVEHTEDERQAGTFGAAFDDYISSRTAVCSPSTIRGYKAIRETAFGSILDTDIHEIDGRTVQEVINKYAANHKAKSCRNAHGLLTAILAHNGIHIAHKATLPQRDKKDIYVPDKAEIERLYRLCKGRKIEPAFLLAAYCGLRASEISALTLDNVNDDYIEVRAARVRGEDGDVLKKPKSYSGTRKVPCTKSFADKLRALAEGDRVITSTSHQITDQWEKFRDKYDITSDLNFHALRHHFASKCLLLGMPQRYVAELMGHSSTDMIERVYQHVFGSAMEEYADKLRADMDGIDNSTDNIKPAKSHK